MIYIGVSEVQPMVTRTLLSNYPVTLGDRQSPPLISSGLQSFEKDTALLLGAILLIGMKYEL